jgi:UDP-GlcNAc:undecaprenyl-phosphate GlcNAc-1-phosphate transferase
MSNLWIIRILVIVCAGVAFLISLGATPISMKLANLVGAIDVPKDDRRMHKTATPRFGGFAIFLGASITILLIRFVLFYKLPDFFQQDEPIEKLGGVLIGGVLIYLVGAYDDIKGMKAVVKFICQIVCAFVAFVFGIRIPAISVLGLDFADNSVSGLALSCVVTIIWIVLITNTINLIDGLDGLAGGVAAISSLAIAYAAYIHGQYVVALSMVALAGAAVGFLPFNFYPAKIFMGDSGALLLGFMLATISVIGPAKGATIVATIVPVLVLGVPLFDVIFAIFRRVSKGRPIFSADKGHFHHQLAYMGMGQRRAVLITYGISAVMGLAAILLSRQLYIESISLFFVALLFIVVLVWDWNTNEKSDNVSQ